MAGSDGKPDIQAALAALKESFGNKIPAKIEAIRQSWEKLTATPADSETFKLLHRQTHTLSGTAATYGFDEVGRLAKALEITLQDELTEEPSQWSSAAIDKFETLLTRLEQPDQESSVEKESDMTSLQKPVQETVTAATEETESRSASKLIYLVDDDADFLSTMSMQIETFGYDVAEFTDLTAFSKAVAEQEPSLVIMDVEFDGGPKAGIEYIARINKERDVPLRTIFITGSSGLLTRLDAVRANGLAYYAKPVLVEKLVDAIDRLTHQSVEEPYKIVIVDDAPEQSAFAALTLQQAGMETREVNEPLKLLALLAEFPPDLILMDIYMPECNGLELSRVIRQMDAFVSTPIVFLSSEHDQRKQLGAMSLGGDDFLTKPVQPWHLVSAVTSRVKRGRMIRKLAETDGLTGLLNHSKSKERLEAELARAKREQSHLSFAMLDIDFFKKVNDNYGHPAGDRVLKSLANMFKQRLRQYDVVGRYGGEEFVVILPNTDAATAKLIMDKMRESFSKIDHFSEDGNFTCNFSCGIASYPDFDTGRGLNDEADKALYEAKEGGRNRVIVAKGC
ncbi:MAG: diguanylate cyclase [Zetaproteobacteria bacterium CG_4_9_14_3_um_filter_53_7]|nr:MAG: diguanylate cyclase [Zetaproteobacteria bacterium CG_4_9_14_3_um_filter_53_7]